MAAAAPTDTPILNRLRRAPRDAVVADETPTLEKWHRPSSDFPLSTAPRPVDGLRRCRRRGRSNLVWLGVRGHFDQSKFRSNPRIPESPDPCLANTGLARESIVDRVLPACSRSIQDGLSVGTDRLSCSPPHWSGGDRSSFRPIGEGHPIALGRSPCRICGRSRPGACELCLPDSGGRNVARTGWGWVLLARAQRSAGVLLRVDQPLDAACGYPALSGVRIFTTRLRLARTGLLPPSTAQRPGGEGRLRCFLGYFGYRVEDFMTASGHRVRSEHERCDGPLDEVEGDKGDGARDEQDVGFVALEDRVKGGEWVRHAPS